MAVHLRNPHSVLAALEQRPQAVVEIRLPTDKPTGAWRQVVEAAREIRVPILRSAPVGDSRRRQRHAPANSGRSGQAEATVKERATVSVEELFANAVSVRDGCGLWLALDRIQDPHNVGAIFRAAAFFGVVGVIITRDQSAPLSQTVYDVASGGIEHVPFSSPPNLSRALKTAKKAGLWILGATEHAETGMSDVARDRPWVLVLGNEEGGLRRLTLDQCDCVCALSGAGPVKSLNVSVAAGVLMSQLTSLH